jgi:hypothetical protein
MKECCEKYIDKNLPKDCTDYGGRGICGNPCRFYYETANLGLPSCALRIKDEKYQHCPECGCSLKEDTNA